MRSLAVDNDIKNDMPGKRRQDTVRESAEASENHTANKGPDGEKLVIDDDALRGQREQGQFI